MTVQIVMLSSGCNTARRALQMVEHGSDAACLSCIHACINAWKMDRPLVLLHLLS